MKCKWTLLGALALAVAGSAVAQSDPADKVELTGEYSYFRFNPTLPAIKNRNFNGGGFDASFFLRPAFGIKADLMFYGSQPFTTTFPPTVTSAGIIPAGTYSANGSLKTYLFGPIIKIRRNHFEPFVQVLFGVAHTDAYANLSKLIAVAPGATLHVQGNQNPFALAAGGGVDVPLNRHIGIRLADVDYVLTRLTNPLTSTNNQNHFRYAGGLQFRFGGAPPLPPMAATCSIQPTAVLAGEPVTATVNVTNIPPKHTINYDWKTTGGKVTSKEVTAQIDTAGMAPGQYTVTATATDPKAKKHAVAPTCTAQFTINEPPKHPPTLSCSASPTTVKVGEPSTITATGENPDNRPLTYSYTASAGKVSGTGTTATLDTAGAPAGPITVTGTVTDDRGLTANCTATVSVEAPPPPPQASKIGECDFPNTKKPWRIDNACKAVLDDVALGLQRDPNATLVIVGQAGPSERKPETLAAQRAVNAKAYLSSGEAKQSIDPARMGVRRGSAGTVKVEYFIVPQGATFDETGSQPVDENQVKPNAPAPAKKGKKPAASAPTQ